MENKDGLCEAEVKKNLVLAEIGQPLTLPLATLNRSCEFRKEWDRIQNIWHGKYESKEAKAKKKEYHKEYYKEYNQRPEIKAKQKEYYKEYNQRPEIKAKQKEYHKEYNQRPEIKAKQKEYYKRKKHQLKLNKEKQINE